MDTKASSKVSNNANRRVLLKLQETGGGGFLLTPQGGKAMGKWWGVNFRQTVCALFVFFSQPPEKPESVIHSDPTTTSVSNCWLTKRRIRKKNTMQLPPLPIKTELNKSSSSNHSHMNTYVAVIHNQRHFCPTCTDIISNQCCMHLTERMLSFLWASAAWAS